ARIQGGTDAWNDARQALDHGLALLGREGLDRLAERRLASPLARVRLEAPIPRPARNVFCLGRNYKEHAAERGAEAPPHPVYFTKLPESVLPPAGKVVHYSVTKEPDYEVELTAANGAARRAIRPDHSLAGGFGYTVINHVAPRDLQ